MDLHPKEDASLHIRRLRGAPLGHYVRSWADIWQALEQNSNFYVVDVQFTPFTPDAGRVYIKCHMHGLAAGVAQSAAEDEMRRWIVTYAARQKMWHDIRTRYLRPRPSLHNGILVAQTVLQFEAVVCHLVRGATSPIPPKRPESDTYRTWRSASYPERIAHAG